ncbi:ATP-dependent protease [Candidatus Marinamargulisbacteria bacterium SCGC AG-439-L15]|nr:ATP-dependent protease [Candidatus Marinamargulisbacteria bacterium SCGC AG-439-L15]
MFLDLSNTDDSDEKKENKKERGPHKNLDELTNDIMAYLKANPEDSILLNEDVKKAPEPPKKTLDDIQFELKPKEIKAHLDRFIIKQDEAKKILGIAICDHFNQIRAAQKGHKKHYTKQNIIMIGPTGVGKTYLIKCIAELIGVPFVKSDATKFTETGYQGGDVEDLVRQLYTKADENTELAQYGIIYLDEIDKVSTSSQKQQKDVSGRGVQTNLLKLMEETEVPTKAPWDINSQLKNFMGPNKKDKPETINTKYILFIVSGAFVGLEDIIKSRVQGSKYGFEQQAKKVDEEHLLLQVSSQDLIKYGLEPEFVGRMPVRVSCEALTEKELLLILTQSEESLLEQYIDSFLHYGIHIRFTESALKEIAHQAFLEKTGARGLGTVLERTFRDYKFELPSTTITTFLVSKTLVSNPQKVLKKLLKDPEKFEKEYFMEDIKTHEKTLSKKLGIQIQFDEDIRDQIITRSKTQKVSIDQTCHDLTDTLLVSILELNTTTLKKLIITKELISNPITTIKKWAANTLSQNKNMSS